MQLNEFIGFNKIPTLKPAFSNLLDENRMNIVLHAKSQGSAVEWGVDKFIELAKTLDSNNATIFFTGTEKEAQFFREMLPNSENIIDLSGKMTLDDLISFIANSDALVAASTGPLHIAGISGIRTIGLFSKKKPIHAGRWKPLGNQVVILEEKNISDSTQPLDIDIRDVKKEVEKVS